MLDPQNPLHDIRGKNSIFLNLHIFGNMEYYLQILQLHLHYQC